MRAGPYVTAPHSQHHVRCRPHEQAMLPTRKRPGRNGWPRGQRTGGRTIHCRVVERTSSPTPAATQATLDRRTHTCAAPVDAPNGRPLCSRAVEWDRDVQRRPALARASASTRVRQGTFERSGSPSRPGATGTSRRHPTTGRRTTRRGRWPRSRSSGSRRSARGATSSSCPGPASPPGPIGGIRSRSQRRW